MQARKITKQEFMTVESTPVKMTKKMHAACKLINVARYNTAYEKVS